MERKVAHAGGKRTFDETIELNKKIAELRQELEDEIKEVKMMRAQVKHVSDEKTNYERAVAQHKQRIHADTEKLKEIELENDSADLELNQIVNEKVNHSMDERMFVLLMSIDTHFALSVCHRKTLLSNTMS